MANKFSPHSIQFKLYLWLAKIWKAKDDQETLEFYGLGEGKYREAEEGDESDSRAQLVSDLHEDMAKSTDSFDKQLVVLSGGSLGISITILKDFLGQCVPAQPWLLCASWGLLLLCLGLSLLSHLLSGMIAQMTIWKNYYECSNDSHKQPPPIIENLNFLCYALLIFGALFLFGFMGVNLKIGG